MQDLPETFLNHASDVGISNAEKQRRKRKRAKADGICNICFAARARAGMVTCQDCSDAAAGRVRAARKAAKKRTRKH